MRTRLRPALIALAATAAVAIAANLIVLAGAVLANGPVIVNQPGMTVEITAGPAIAATIAGALAGAIGSLVLVSLLPASGVRVLVVVGALLTLLSLAGTLAATTTVGVGALALMHVVTGTVVIVGNAVIHTRSSRSEARAAQPTR